MSKDKNPKRTARRVAKQRRRLPPDARCVACGESAPEALECHHVMGRAHQRDLTAPLCRNCHAKATEEQLREETPLRATENLPERLAAILGALAAFFRFLADSLDRLAEQLKAFIGSLDARCPGWRTAQSQAG